jgi:acetylornithine deacetylase/succinyl-diaminopimelate desuccinylase-like protein
MPDRGHPTSGRENGIDVADTTAEVTDLLQQLIRNGCVNDGRPESGWEVRSASLLESYLEGAGLELERYESAPGRDNLVTRIEGSDPTAPTLLLLGHTDVVPVNPDGWRHDPFGGELIDGVVWGRGAVDMLNLTASMAVAVKHLAGRGFSPRGTLIYAAVADEEALGTFGAAWLLKEHPDAVRADYVITESGGFKMPLPSTTGPKLPVIVAEKGAYWCTLRIRGTPGHASMPFRTDNALVKAAKVVCALDAIDPAPRLDDVWNRFVSDYDLPPALGALLADPAGVREYLEGAAGDEIGLARELHAVTRTTYAPTIAHGGVKANVIPDAVNIQVDIRTVPGDTAETVRAAIAKALGSLGADVEIIVDSDDPPNASPLDTPLWRSLQSVSERLVPGARIVPLTSTGATDARFFRALGATAYGYALFSDRITYDDYGAMFHGNDERVDQESLLLSTALWEATAEDLLAGGGRS